MINLSLGAPVLQPYQDDPVCEAVERAIAAGMVVRRGGGQQRADASTASAFWAGSRRRATIRTRSRSVRSTRTGRPYRSDDTVAASQLRSGPTRSDLALKPDLVAPGSHIVSAEAQGSYLATTYLAAARDGRGRGRLPAACRGPAWRRAW